MTIEFDNFKRGLRLLILDDSLLYLNAVLAASRSEVRNQFLEARLSALKPPLPAFFIHFLAKWVLLEGSNPGLYSLDWPRFHRLMRQFFELPDPITDDPGWPSADPSGFFLRIAAQQFPSQHSTWMRDYGLCLGLFRDAALACATADCNLRDNLESELGVSIEDFMRMGFLCMATGVCKVGGKTLRGTITPPLLAKASVDGLHFSAPAVWEPFLKRVACTRDEFRELSARREYRVNDERFVLFEFNGLLQRPFIEVQPGRYLAVDPNLIITRTTWGLFYDLFDRSIRLHGTGTKFKEQFGPVFEQFVGNLLSSIYPPDRLWSDASWRRMRDPKTKLPSKVADWIVKTQDKMVLVECKSHHPALPLVTYGGEDAVAELVNRVATAVEKLVSHHKAIMRGAWEHEELVAAPAAYVVVTYGHFHGGNIVFLRKRVASRLVEMGCEPVPYALLSLEELDCAVRLVERGNALDRVIETLSRDDSANLAYAFREQLQTDSVSTYARTRYSELIESIGPNSAKGR